jgi:hypothetical protein
MARKRKSTVDYFPHDANASSKKTLVLLEKRYGITGYGFWFKLLETLAVSDNHFLDLNRKGNVEYLSSKAHISEELCLEILDELAGLDAIDPELWESRIVWVENFISGVVDAYSRRSQAAPTRAEVVEVIQFRYPPKVINNQDQSGDIRELNPRLFLTVKDEPDPDQSIASKDNVDHSKLITSEMTSDENNLSSIGISGDIRELKCIKETKVNKSKEKQKERERALTVVKAEQAPDPSNQEKQSRHFADVVEKESGASIAERLIAACRQCALRSNGKFNPFQWVQTVMNCHPEAVIETLENVTENLPAVEKVWPYAGKVLRTRDFRYRERAEIDKMRLISPTVDEAKAAWMKVVELLKQEKTGRS